MESMKVYETTSVEETCALAGKLGSKAVSGQVYLLSGDLGTGKTAFAQGFASGLGIDDYVNSPTFTIMQIYDSGRMPLYHFDVYRIEEPEEMEEIGYEEYFYGQGVCLIEWASLVEEIIPKEAVRITIEKNLERGFDYRKITVRGTGKQ